MGNQETKIYAFEGLDGSGKTSTSRLVKSELEAAGFSVGWRRHPNTEGIVGKTLIHGKRMEITLPKEMDRLFVYDLKRSIRSIPPGTDIMLWDRYIDSVYTSNDQSVLADVLKLAEGLRLPNKTFFLELSPEFAFQRAVDLSLHALTLEWLQLKYARYQELIQTNPERYVVIDSTQPQEIVVATILGEIRKDYER